MRSTSTIGQGPLNPLNSFTAFACGLERITVKDAAMIDLQKALDQSRKLHETLAMAKGAVATGGDALPILVDANARLIEVANAMGHFADPIDAATADEPHDDAARSHVEHERIAAE